ncbi:hypothetical protein ZYGR_0I07610 [Zygosaccharomyces rouxii]|uniref:ZYRO0C17996p n=2 Tax=Zygosaccharomyces rouxii TaxID=4956 RepID=C5DUM5_ZYGRC|nr:uncharacterized protein ZYRO0C17996g [Zygosaccharomyces rouxii]KAH9201343.1 Bud site selection protein 5 [Zygosaccharomyces rouxii]GAV48464.1 hypothetical protein ZYGR_0I07610 [Zygosaccharomyces rouxii]CAQ43556.1 Bud site selection protein 5 [Zygosaccharomyces rouxii]CAR27486.1 ZYRO0C17996p [Zygosaccharomyces rouxii]
MASRLNTGTQPLFMRNDADYASPTRRSFQFPRRYSNKSSTHSSFSNQVEESLHTVGDDVQPATPERFVFLQDFNNDDTPVVNNSNNRQFLDEDAVTPLINQEVHEEEGGGKQGEYYMTESVYSEYDNTSDNISSENENSTSEPFAGLGIDGVNRSGSVSSYVETAKAAPIISSKTSPVRAIRTSAIINGKGNSSPFKEPNYISGGATNNSIGKLDTHFLNNSKEYSRYSIISGETSTAPLSLPNDKFTEAKEFEGDQEHVSESELETEASDSDLAKWDAVEIPTTKVPQESQSSVVNMSRNNSNIQRKTTLRKNTELELDDKNFAYLFIIAIHSFNARTLDNPDDIAICLSFEKGDVAFVHTVDESGWGEVTLVRNRKRGWVPFNYFSDTVKFNRAKDSTESGNQLTNLIESRSPLQALLSACAKFLLHPQDTPIPNSDKFTFNFNHINTVKDGVKKLLEKTECVSRSDELVRQSPSVRKLRKRLLADWYNLMIKADYYKYSTNPENISKLMDLLYRVLEQSFSFFKAWAQEKTEFEKERTAQINSENTLKDSEKPAYMRNSPMHYLREPPSAIGRLQEVYDLLFLYVGLILGRLDLIEHNASGSEMLEVIVHQMIILLRELLYTSKSCSSIIQDKFQYAYDDTLQRNLDPLLSLVSELVSCVKLLVVDILKDNVGKDMELLVKEDLYHHTDQGQRLISIVSSMATLISNTVSGCNSYLRLIGDFQLSEDRKYLDLQEMKITPQKFVSHCTEGLKKDIDEARLSRAIQEQQPNRSVQNHKSIARFSTIRAGDGEKLGLTVEGGQFLQELFQDRRPFGRDSKFAPFQLKDGDEDVGDHVDEINNKEAMHKQLMFNKEGALIGASFKALVYKLTDEIEKPDEFFTAAFLLNFRSFGTALDLIEALVSRFDFSDKSIRYEFGEKNGQYSSRASRMKNRRRLVCRVFLLWMKTYWNYYADYQYLPTLINFFNEGLSVFLPLDAKELLETAAKLSALTPFSGEFRRRSRSRHQLQPTSTHEARTCSIYSDISVTSASSRRSSGSLDHQLLDDHDLTRIPSQSRNSMSLPLPVLNYGTSSLISKRNIQDMERLLISYRLVTGYSTSALNKSASDFNPQNDTRLLIAEWNELVSSDMRISQPLVHNDMTLVQINALELAKQLTLIESQLFLAVEPFELLDGNYMPKKHYLGMAPNVKAILNFTNQLSNYVIECILYPNLPLRERTSRLRAWLKIALATSYFRNFNSLAAIMTALQNHALTRLQDVWDELSDKELDLYKYLARVVHPNNNFKVYRKKLKKYTEDYRFGNTKPSKSLVPVVPFFNLFLQDLTFINEGNANSRDDLRFRPYTLINIDKYFKITKTINIVNFFQVDYESNPEGFDTLGSFFNIGDQLDQDNRNIKPIPLVQEFILYEFWRVNTLFKENNDRGYQLSLSLKPRTFQ